MHVMQLARAVCEDEEKVEQRKKGDDKRKGTMDVIGSLAAAPSETMRYTWK